MSHNRTTALILWIPLATFLSSLYVLFTLNPVHVPIPRLSKNGEIPAKQHNYLVYTDGCKIPHTDPFDESIKPFIEAPADVVCSTVKPLFESIDSFLVVSDTSPLAKYFLNSTKLACCYRAFGRISPVGEEKEGRVQYASACVPLKAHTTEIREEFVHVICTVSRTKKVAYQDYFSFVPFKNFRPFPRTTNAPPLNVLLIGMSSVSRLNLHRQMPRTVDALRSLDAIELLGYGHVDSSPRSNLLPLLTGLSEGDLRSSVLTDRYLDSCPFVWKAFKQRGHVTTYGGDSSSAAPFNDDVASGFRRQPTDYYWDTFEREAESKIGSWKLLNAKLCLGSGHAHKILLRHVTSVATTMRKHERKYFGMYWFSGFSREDLNMPRIADDDFGDFLAEMEIHGHLTNTALFFFSDHGLMGRNVSLSFQGQLEERLPFLFVVLPEWFARNHTEAYRNLEDNARRLTTPYDVHRTLVDLLDGIAEERREKVVPLASRGTSLFRKISSSRTCKGGGISKKRCACQRSLKVTSTVDKLDIIFNASAAAVVDWINFKLAPYDACSQLRVKAIWKATPMSNWDFVDKLDAFIDVNLVITTEPGDGVFGATVRYFTGREEMGRTKVVTRVVRHDKQKHIRGACRTYLYLQPFCHCKSETENVYSDRQKP